MNYLAAMILFGVDMQEDYAFTILVHLLSRVEDDGFKLEALFDSQLSGVLALSSTMQEWL